jgi:hypothetical protein
VQGPGADLVDVDVDVSPDKLDFCEDVQLRDANLASCYFNDIDSFPKVDITTVLI